MKLVDQFRPRAAREPDAGFGTDCVLHKRGRRLAAPPVSDEVQHRARRGDADLIVEDEAVDQATPSEAIRGSAPLLSVVDQMPHGGFDVDVTRDLFSAAELRRLARFAPRVREVFDRAATFTLRDGQLAAPLAQAFLAERFLVEASGVDVALRVRAVVADRLGVDVVPARAPGGLEYPQLRFHPAGGALVHHRIESAVDLSGLGSSERHLEALVLLGRPAEVIVRTGAGVRRQYCNEGFVALLDARTPHAIVGTGAIGFQVVVDASGRARSFA